MLRAEEGGHERPKTKVQRVTRLLPTVPKTAINPAEIPTGFEVETDRRLAEGGGSRSLPDLAAALT